MDIFQDVITSEDLANETQQVFDDMLASSQPKLVIYEGKPSFVIISSEVYQAQLERLAILEKLERARQDSQAGRVMPHEQVMKEARQRLANTPRQ
jgi:PHD/YefM family antitoxin component YafN of YafNO toxin-antitoxin module